MDPKAHADIQGGDGLGSPPGACYLPSPCSSPFLPACYQALCKDGRKVKKITDMALDVVELLDQHQSNPHYLIFIIHTKKIITGPYTFQPSESVFSYLQSNTSLSVHTVLHSTLTTSYCFSDKKLVFSEIIALPNIAKSTNGEKNT